MSGPAGTYSFLDVEASLVGPGGAISLGAGSGNSEEGITIVPNADRNNMAIGSDGTPMHSLGADKSGTVTVRLLKTSVVNRKLMAMFNLQTASAANHGQNTLNIVTMRGGDVISCRAVAFKRVPDLNYQTNGGMNEWTFDAGIIDGALGAGW